MDPVTLWLLFSIYLAWRFLSDMRNLASHKLAPVTRALGDRATGTGRTKLGALLGRAADRMAARPHPGTPRTASGVRLRDRLRAALQTASGGGRRSWTDQPQPSWRGGEGTGGGGTPPTGATTGGGTGGAGPTGTGPGPRPDSAGPAGGGGPAEGGTGIPRPGTIRGWLDRIRTRNHPDKPWELLDPIAIPTVDAPPPALETATPPWSPPSWLPLFAAQALNAARVAWADAAAAARTAQAKAREAAARRAARAQASARAQQKHRARQALLAYLASVADMWGAVVWPTTGDDEDPATVYATSERVRELGATGSTTDGPTPEPATASLPVADQEPVDAEIVYPPTAADTGPAPITAAPAAALTAPSEGTTTMDNTAAPEAAQSGLSGFIAHSSDMTEQCTGAGNAMEIALSDVRRAIASAEKTLNGIIADEYAGVPVSAYQNAIGSLTTIAEGMEASRQLFTSAANQFGNANTVFVQIKQKLANAHAELEADGTTASSVPSIRS